MSIIRAPRPSASFTVLRNDVLHDDRLSYRARGVLVAILSRPDHWRTDAVTLQRGGTEGREAIRAALTELEVAGYLLRRRSQDAQGRWRTAAFVYDTPQDGDPSQLTLNGDGFPTPGNPSPVLNHDGNPTVGSPAVGELGAVVKTGSKDSNLSVPTERASRPEDVIAKAIYEHTEGMVKYLAVRQIATRALKQEGVTPDQVQSVMARLYDQGRPLTLTTVGQALRNGFGRPAVSASGATEPQDEHFRTGGTW